jgi:uncharacterized repeat protein (TIGR01451 family)
MHLPITGQRNSKAANEKLSFLSLTSKDLKILFIVAILFSTVFAGPFMSLPPAHADGYPPYWDNSTTAVHFAPVAWPSESAWIPYTYQGVGIKDQRTNDPSNGGTTPQNYVNVSSQCTDQSLPSVAWYFDTAKQVIFFRWRVEQIANTYATGPTPGTYSSTDPWKSAQWTVMIDIDGDGYREFAFHLNGSSGSPSAAIDVVTSIYSDTKSQSIDYIGDPSVYELFHNPAAIVYKSYGAGDPYNAYNNYILNFRNSFNPVPVWPNGTAETVWDYGTTRSTNISTPTCTEYYIDYQVPLAMLDATAYGGPAVTVNTPISISFVSANSLQNPLQKDAVFDGTFVGAPESCLPFGDTIALSGTTIPQPVVDWIKAEGCNTTTLTAQVRDAISSTCQDTLQSVDFYYYYDRNANGIADDTGISWTLVGPGTVDTSIPSKWTYSGWDTTGLDRGRYLLGVQAKDNTVSGNANLTFSYLTTANLPVAAPGETNYSNPSPSPGVVTDIFNNTCGEYAALTKSVSPAYTSAGSNVTFTMTVTNNTSAALTITSITDVLPSGFSYQDTPAESGTLTGIVTGPSNNATGNITWTFSGAGAIVGANSSKTFTFTSKVSSVTGTYSNSASAVTSDPDWTNLTSNSVDIGVGTPSLTIAKAASDYSVEPNDPITYTITYSNDSPVNTTGVVITDVLPVGLNFIAADKGGTYDSGTRTITWTIGDLASLEGPYTVSFNATVDKTATIKTVNTATISSDETAPASASASIYVKTPLNIDKTANKPLVYPAQASPDNQVIYTISYQNTGSGSLSNATITDPTPPGFSYMGLTGNALFTGAAVETSGDGYGDDDSICEAVERCIITWTASGPLTAGASGSVTLTLQADNPYSGDNYAVNTATIAATGVPAVFDTAQIGVVETGGVCYSNFFHDETENVGADSPPLRQTSTTVAPLPSDTGASVTVWAPAGASYLEAMRFYNPVSTIDQPFSDAITTRLYVDRVNGVGSWIRGEIFDYDPVTGIKNSLGFQNQYFNGSDRGLYEFTITPTGGTLYTGHRLLWVFSARSSHPTNPVQLQLQYDGTVANTLSGTTPATFANSHARLCSSRPELVLTKDVDKKTAAAGDSLQYTLNFANLGVNNASGGQITDILPAGTSFVSATLNGSAAAPVGGTCPLNVCTFNVNSSDTATSGQITGKNSGVLVINALIANPVSPINSLTNRATLVSNETDPVSDAVTTNIGLSGLPEISVIKSASKTLLFPGDTVTYTLSVVNTGSGTAISTTVTDVIPAEAYYTYVSGSIAGEGNNDSGVPTLGWTLSSMAPGDSRTLTYQMLVGGTVPSGVTTKSNTASATEGGRNYTGNTVTVSITANPSLSISKTVSAPAPYTQTVSSGDNTLSNIPVQLNTLKILENGAEIGADSGTGFMIGNNLKNSTINYTTGVLHLEFITAPAGTITAKYNKPASPGDTLEYTITVSNIGGSDAANIIVTDPIPSYTTYINGTLEYQGSAKTDETDGDEAYFDSANNRTVFNIGAALAKTSTRTMKFSVVLSSVMPNGTTALTNTAAVSASNTASKSAEAAFNVQATPVLGLSKSAPDKLPYTTTAAPIFASNKLSVNYSLSFNVGDVISVGGTTATITAVTYNKPVLLTRLNAAAPVGATSVSVLSAAYISIGDWININNGVGSSTITQVTNIIGNTLTISPALTYAAGNNNPVNVINVVTDVNVTSGINLPVRPAIKFSLSYINSGEADATNVSVRDTLQSNLTFVPSPYSSSACSSAGQVVTCTVGTVPAGGSGSFIVRAIPAAAGTYTNSGLILSSELTPINSNATTTVIGALELSKSTSTANVTNSVTGTTATYTISLRNEFATAASGVSVTDTLPAGFSYAGTGAISGGACNPAFNPTAPSRVLGTDGLTYTCVLSHTASASNIPITGADWRYYWVRTGGGGVAWVNGSSYTAQNQPTWGSCTVNASGTLSIPFTVNVAPTVGADTYQNSVAATSANMSVLPFDELITTAEDVTVIIPGDIKVSKAVTAGPIACAEGSCVDYLITVWNLGTGPATNISVKDTDTDGVTYPPAFLTYVSSTPGTGSYNSGTGVWTIPGPIASGASATLALRFSISQFTSAIYNVASLTASTPADTNPGNDKYSVSLIPTLVTLSSFGAYSDKGRFGLQWTTSSEIDTAGFFLFRLDKSTGKYRQINSNLLPAQLTSQQGGDYSLIDSGASLKKSNTYVLVEIEGKGAKNAYGPFTVMAGGGNATENQYSSNPVDPATLLNGKAFGKLVKSTQRQAGVITKFKDKDGTIVITNKNSKSATSIFAAVDEVSDYVRKTRPVSAEKKARINARIEAKEKARFLKKQRQGQMVKISVSKEGLYYIDSSEISGLLGISQIEVKQLIKTGNLAMSSQGENVAYIPSDSSTGIYFYGQGIDSIYTKENIYWLYRGRGLQMAGIKGNGPTPVGYSAFADTIHAEENKIVAPVIVKDPAADYWFWDYIVGGNPSMGTKTFTIETYGVANAPYAAAMTVRLHGLTNTGVTNDHHVIISLNGTPIGEDFWKGAEERVITLSFSQGLLYNGVNTIEVKGLLDTGAPYSVFYVDSFDLTYQRLYEAKGNSFIFRPGDIQPLTVYGFTDPDIFVFDITDPNKPIFNTAATIDGTAGNFSVSFMASPGARYLATTTDAVVADPVTEANSASALSSANNSADYIVITPGELMSSARELANYRQRKGLDTMVVDLEDIMDEFNYGISSPEAIRDFLRYAYYNWKKAPKYVVLAGDGTYDYKDNLGAGDNLVPTLMTETPQMLSPSDNLFADVDGDHVPDIAIGRLPVLTAEELRGVISKIIAYENTPGRRIIMLADNQDDGGNFPADSDEMVALVPPGYSVGRIYLSSYTLDQARQLLFTGINNGTSLINYTGHAGMDRLANEGLLRTTDVALLQNSGRPFILTAMTCTVGNFALPGFDSLSEALVTKGNGGAVAVWASTGLSFNFQSKILENNFFKGAFRNKEIALGDLILKTFKNYNATGNPVYIMDIYNLQGDPALRMW